MQLVVKDEIAEIKRSECFVLKLNTSNKIPCKKLRNKFPTMFQC